MYYHNTKYKFTLPENSPTAIAGAIVLASAMPQGQLIRRDMRKQGFLQHRVFDPQLYLAGLDPATARKPVTYLATWPWFGNRQVPEYDSGRHGTLRQWKEAHEQALIDGWTSRPPISATDMESAVESAIRIQQALGCEAIIIPGPLTNVTATFETESAWIDCGIEVCRRLQVRVPVFATVALSDNVLRAIDARQNPLLHTITNQISARAELQGAYLVIEQASETGYVCTSRETLLSLLVLIDDLTRGAARQVIVNYMGSFGPAAIAAGAQIFGTGYYLSQRRLKLSDFEDKEGRAYPRYASLRVAGDLGVESDLALAYRTLGEPVLTDTPPAAPLNAAIRAGAGPSQVPEWAYSQTNITAAAAHYNWVMFNLARSLSSVPPNARAEIVHRWLRTAARDAEALRQTSIDRTKSDVVHQSVWLRAFEDWMTHAGINPHG